MVSTDTPVSCAKSRWLSSVVIRILAHSLFGFGFLPIISNFLNHAAKRRKCPSKSQKSILWFLLDQTTTNGVRVAEMAIIADKPRAGIPLSMAGGLPPIREEFSRSAKPVSVIPDSAPAPTNEFEFERRARISGLGQPQYLANTLDVQRIQNALRSAERGDTWILFTIFRDMYASYGHLQSEWAKRKSVITGNHEILIPNDPENKDDVEAAEFIAQIINNCRNWREALGQLLDGTLYPLAAAEKIFEPVGLAEQKKYKLPMRYKLKEIAPIDPTLLCFKLPYIPGYTSKDNPDGVFNPDDWESWLRFYSTNPLGVPNYSMAGIYAPNPHHHIIHRGNFLSPTVPPNFGGQMRTILFPWLLSTQDRDWWGLLMQKYGMPIPVAKVNTQQADTVAYMQQALALCTQLGGLVVDAKATVDWAQVNSTDASGAHKMFQDWTDCNTSKIVIGQSLSAKPEKTGMGSGASQQSEEIREDYRKNDTINLSDTLKRQLFKQCLEINGYIGSPPSVRWGGMRSGEASAYAKTQAQMKVAGYRATARGLRTLNENLGVEYEYDPNAKIPPAGKTINAQDGDNDGNVKY